MFTSCSPMSKKTPMKIHMRKISSLKEASYNPRKLSDKQYENIKESLTRFEMVVPIVVNQNAKRKNIIVGGHQRVRVARDMGIEEIECVYVDLTEEKERECNIRLNQNTGEFDEELLESEFEMGELLDFGFGVDELQFFEIDEKKEPKDPPVIDPPKDAKSKSGKVYQLGRHRLMCGDSTSDKDVQQLIGNKIIDMIYTDPPYGISIVSNNQIGGGGAFGVGKKEKSKGVSISANKYAEVIGDEDITTAVGAINIIKTLNIKTQIIWGGNYYANHLDNSNCWIIWDKETGANTFTDAELAWTNQKTKVRIFKHRWSGMVKASEHGQKRVHPTQKPVALAEWCFENYGNPLSVLDLFGGSGSTLIACEKKDKKCYMMEFSPAYCDVIIIRYCQMVGIDPETIFNG